MKKVIALVSTVVIVMSALVGCGSAKYKDGTYKAEFDAPDSKGWTAFVQVEVKDDKIVNTVFDYKNAEGQLKSKDEGYNTKMKEISGVSAEEFTKQYAEQLTKDQNTSKIDTVTGATTSKADFEALANKALTMAKDGQPFESTIAPLSK